MNNEEDVANEFLKHCESQFMNDLRVIMEQPEGIRVMARILKDAGLFSDTYTNNSTVYKNAALSDFSRRLTERFDKLDMLYLVSIKKYILSLAKYREELYERNRNKQ